MDGVEEGDAVGHGALEGFAAADEAEAAGTLVDDGGADGFGQVAGTGGGTAGVDEADAAHVAVGHLPAGEVDGMVGGQLVVDQRVGLAEPQGGVAAVVLGELLLDDVGLDGHPEVVGLAGEVGGGVIVGAVHLEIGVPQVAPQHGEHAALVGPVEGLGHLLDLAGGLLGAEVDGGPHSSRAQVVGLLDRSEHHLVELVGIGEQLIVVELDDERDAVGEPARHRPQYTEGGGHRVATPLDGQLHDARRVEIPRVGGEGGRP